MTAIERVKKYLNGPDAAKQPSVRTFVAAREIDARAFCARCRGYDIELSPHMRALLQRGEEPLETPGDASVSG